MEVYYNKVGIPFLVKDGVIYEFGSPNSPEIVAELALDIELFNSIKNSIIISIKNTNEKLDQVSETDTVSKTLNIINDLFFIPQFNSVLNVLNQAEDIQYQLINPQPYQSWHWDGVGKKWVPPTEPPLGYTQEELVWDESLMQWTPLIARPHNGWIWSWDTKSWNPPVSYPIGAEENEFIWSEELETWVLNEQIS